jgi:hypothetical protein
MKNVKIKLLNGNGDFRSEECLKILKEADIVVTNPPFSLFRELFNILVKEGKGYLIMGPLLAYFYKDIAKEIIKKRCRPGRSIRNVSLNFYRGEEIVKVSGFEWFTNLHKWYPGPLPLTEEFSPEKYPKYDNYDVIESKVKDIPKDYDGEIGVPISFVDKWCPDQFEIIGFLRPVLKGKEVFARCLIKRR